MGSLDSQSGRVLKCLVVFFNSIFFILGIVLIAVGVWAEVTYGDFIDITSVEYATGARIVIGVGCIIAIVSFVGCIGAWKENRCLLITFFVFLLILVALEIAGIALAYERRDKLSDHVEKDLLNAVQKDYSIDSQKGTTKAIDKLQEKEKCCGVQNYTDWFRSKYSNGIHMHFPDSCCKIKSQRCGNLSIPGHTFVNIYRGGCYPKLLDLLRDKLVMIGAFAITMLVIQVLGMVFALVLVIKIGKSGEYV